MSASKPELDPHVVPLHAVEARQGKQPLLLLHGLGRNHSTFLPLVKQLPPFWNPWLLDLRGHGSSPWGDGHYRVVDYLADVLAWIRGRWKTPAVVYGHSLGAMVAAALAASAPESIGAIILEDPPFQSMGHRMRGTFYDYYFRGLLRTVGTSGGVDALLQQLREIPVPLNGCGEMGRLEQLRDPASLRFAAECLVHVDPAVFRPVIDETWLDAYDLAAICPRIQCPVFLLQGNPELGSVLTDEDAGLFQRTVADCRLARFAHKGHQIHWPVPDSILPVFKEVEQHL